MANENLPNYKHMPFVTNYEEHVLSQDVCKKRAQTYNFNPLLVLSICIHWQFLPNENCHLLPLHVTTR